VYALLGAVQCAQRGGVGIIIYFRKEGRSLGEVTKFRVYNARKVSREITFFTRAHTKQQQQQRWN